MREYFGIILNVEERVATNPTIWIATAPGPGKDHQPARECGKIVVHLRQLRNAAENGRDPNCGRKELRGGVDQPETKSSQHDRRHSLGGCNGRFRR